MSHASKLTQGRRLWELYFRASWSEVQVKQPEACDAVWGEEQFGSQSLQPTAVLASLQTDRVRVSLS